MDQGYIDQEKRIVGIVIFQIRIFIVIRTSKQYASKRAQSCVYNISPFSFLVSKEKAYFFSGALAPLMLKLSSFMNIFGNSTSYFTVKMVSMDQYNKAKTLSLLKQIKVTDYIFLHSFNSTHKACK